MSRVVRVSIVLAMSLPAGAVAAQTRADAERVPIRNYALLAGEWRIDP